MSDQKDDEGVAESELPALAPLSKLLAEMERQLTAHKGAVATASKHRILVEKCRREEAFECARLELKAKEADKEGDEEGARSYRARQKQHRQLHDMLEAEEKRQADTVAELNRPLGAFYARIEDARRKLAALTLIERRTETIRLAEATRQRLADHSVFDQFDELFSAGASELLSELETLRK